MRVVWLLIILLGASAYAVDVPEQCAMMSKPSSLVYQSNTEEQVNDMLACNWWDEDNQQTLAEDLWWFGIVQGSVVRHYIQLNELDQAIIIAHEYFEDARKRLEEANTIGEVDYKNMSYGVTHHHALMKSHYLDTLLLWFSAQTAQEDCPRNDTIDLLIAFIDDTAQSVFPDVRQQNSKISEADKKIERIDQVFRYVLQHYTGNIGADRQNCLAKIFFDLPEVKGKNKYALSMEFYQSYPQFEKLGFSADIMNN